MPRVTSLVLALTLPLSACGSDEPAPGDGNNADEAAAPAKVGQWSEPASIQAWGVHSILNPTGKLLIFMGHGLFAEYPSQSALWDPESEKVVHQNYDAADDLFCSGHTFLPSGESVITGGGGGLPNLAIRTAYRFDPFREEWTKTADMNLARWYPTLLTLADGRVLAMSGTGIIPTESEIFDPDANTWTRVDGSIRSLPETYPSARLLPNGQIYTPGFGFADDVVQHPQAGVMTLAKNEQGEDVATWEDGHSPNVSHEEGGSTYVVHDDQEPPLAILTAYGGGATGISGTLPGNETEKVEQIDLSANPAAREWRPLPGMHHDRTNVTALTLADGKVLVVGGQTGGVWNPSMKPVLIPEIFDPETLKWTEMAPMKIQRHYHSTAILLPDGRVLATGSHDPKEGGPFEGCAGGQAFECKRDLRNYEIFSPPYLFASTRPQITGAPDAFVYGSDVEIAVKGDKKIASVRLITPASITHHTDTGRAVELLIRSSDDGSVVVRAPSAATVAPPGFYMLFVVDEAGVPSVAKFVQVTPPAAP